ncbi:hypothetical protein [Sphingobacterium sp. LRF_L2]|uniref:hypothetical protein n=1 Tax=Sphingobacterium sp. LRF_L2 TaxID=3369421 RepID=UPI003F63A7B0
MSKKTEQTLRYDWGYRLFILASLLVIVTFVAYRPFHLSTLNSSSGFIGFSQIAILVLAIAVIYFLAKYAYYVFTWKAIINENGCTIILPVRSNQVYYWDRGDIVLGKMHQLALAAKLKDGSFRTYQLSLWVTGKQQLIDSHFRYLHARWNDLAQKAGVAVASPFSDALEVKRKKRFNYGLIRRLFIVLYTFFITLWLAALVFLGSVPDRVFVQILICVALATQIHLVVRYWKVFESIWFGLLIGCASFSIILWNILIFDLVHVESEFFFLRWGAVFAFIMTLGIRCLLPSDKKSSVLTSRIRLYPILFLLLSMYFIPALKLGNMIDAERDSSAPKSHSQNFWQLSIPDEASYRGEESSPIDGKAVRMSLFQGKLGIGWFYGEKLHIGVENAMLIEP